jgi:hypothetical protein
MAMRQQDQLQSSTFRLNGQDLAELRASNMLIMYYVMDMQTVDCDYFKLYRCRKIQRIASSVIVNIVK